MQKPKFLLQRSLKKEMRKNKPYIRDRYWSMVGSSCESWQKKVMFVWIKGVSWLSVKAVMVFADLCGQCDKRSERVTRECTGCCQLCAIQASSHVFCHHDCSRSLLHIDGFLHVPSGYCAGPAKVCHLFYTWLFVHHWLLFCPQRAKDPVSTHDFQRGLFYFFHPWVWLPPLYLQERERMMWCLL